METSYRGSQQVWEGGVGPPGPVPPAGSGHPGGGSLQADRSENWSLWSHG